MAGQVAQVRESISDLRREKIPHKLLYRVADLSRRAGVPALGLRVLRPIVRDEKPSSAKENPREKALYSALLTMVGASDEALEILGELKDSVAESLFYTALAHVSQWNYPAALPLLEAYIKRGEINDYQRMVGKLNLLSCYVFCEKFAEAEVLFNEVLITTREKGWLLLQGIALENGARLRMDQGQWDQALAPLEEAANVLRDSTNVQLFVKKWKALMPLRRNGARAETLDPVRELRAEAMKIGHFETVRDCDYYLALATSHQDLFNRLYFGTPFAAFRDRLLRKAGLSYVRPTTYLLMGDGLAKPERIFDLQVGTEVDGTAKLKAGQKLHLLLRGLCRDFYRPVLIGTLFGSVCPGEFYDPANATKKVDELVRRLRLWIKESELPFEVVVENNSYRLSNLGFVALRVADPIGEMSSAVVEAPLNFNLQKVRQRLENDDFSCAHVAEILELSTRRASTLLSQAVQAGELSRSGEGRATRYRFTTNRGQK